MSKHSKERIQERYNLELTYSDENNILKIVNKGQAILLSKESNNPNRKFGYVLYKNIPIKILYEVDESDRAVSIITSYPFDADEYNEVIDSIFKSHIHTAMKFLQKNGYVVFKKGSLHKELKL